MLKNKNEKQTEFKSASSQSVVWRCSVKQVFLKISQNSQENTCGRATFVIKLQAYKRYRTQNSGACFWKKISEFLNNIIESLLKMNDSSVFLRKDHIKSENIFYSDIFKYERGLTKYDLIPKHGLLQRSFIHGNFQTIVTADAFLHCLRIKLPLHFLEIVQKLWRCSMYKKSY